MPEFCVADCPACRTRFRPDWRIGGRKLKYSQRLRLRCPSCHNEVEMAEVDLVVFYAGRALLLGAGGSVRGAGPDLSEQRVRLFDQILDLVVMDSFVVEGRSLQYVPHLDGQRIAPVAPCL